MENIDVGEIILKRHIGETNPSFYAGRGPCPSDLDGIKLYGIFLELNRLDKEYGQEFIKLVDSIPSIGATEFIKAFNDFSENGFIFQNKVNEFDGIILEGKDNEEMMHNALVDIVAALGLFSTNRSEEEAKRKNYFIKEAFYERVRCFYETHTKKSFYSLEDLKHFDLNKDVLEILNPYSKKNEEMDNLYSEHTISK